LARAAGLTVAVFALAATAHLAAGGRLPSVPWSVALLMAAFWFAVAVTGRRLGRLATVVLVAGSQLLLHEAFGFTSAARSCLVLAPEHAGHLSHGAGMLCAHPVMAMGSQHGSGVVMAAAHAVAAAAVGLVLARGEAAVWFLASLVWAPLPSLARPRLGGVRVLTAATPSTVRGRLWLGGVGRRGPPSPVVASTA